MMSPQLFQTSFRVAAAGTEWCLVISFQLPDLGTVAKSPFLIQDAGEVSNLTRCYRFSVP
ncbi:MAG: hypothetical protein WCS94_25615 [Verrucomicrobiota bacterium]